MTDKKTEALKRALDWIEGNGKYDAAKRIAQTIREALAEESSGTEEPDINLNCKSVQARLATSWGYVKAEQPAQCPHDFLMGDDEPDHDSVCMQCGATVPNDEQPVQQQKPVAWANKVIGGKKWLSIHASKGASDKWLEYRRKEQAWSEQYEQIALYTPPPKRTWVGLTEGEIEDIWRKVQANDFHDCVQPFARAIEAKLREKNA